MFMSILGRVDCHPCHLLARYLFTGAVKMRHAHLQVPNNNFFPPVLWQIGNTPRPAYVIWQGAAQPPTSLLPHVLKQRKTKQQIVLNDFIDREKMLIVTKWKRRFFCFVGKNFHQCCTININPLWQ